MALDLPRGMRGPSSANARSGVVSWIAFNPITGRYKLCRVGARKLVRDLHATLGRQPPAAAQWTLSLLADLRTRLDREAGQPAAAAVTDTGVTRAAIRAAVWLCYEQRSGDVVPGGTPESRIWLPDSLTIPASGQELSDDTAPTCAPITAADAPPAPAPPAPAPPAPRQANNPPPPPPPPPPRPTEAGMLSGGLGAALALVGAVGLGAVVVSRVAPPPDAAGRPPVERRETPAPPPRNPPPRVARPRRRDPGSVDEARALLG